MNIFLNDTQHWYQVQNVCRLFYPGEDFVLSDTEQNSDLCCDVNTDTTVQLRVCHAQSGRTLTDTVFFIKENFVLNFISSFSVITSLILLF